MKNNIETLKSMKNILGPFEDVYESCIVEKIRSNVSNKQLMLKNKMNKYGVILEDGHMISCSYDSVGSFYDGSAFACKNEEWLLIDKDEKILKTYGKHEGAYCVLRILAVQKDGLWGAINKDGELVIPYKYLSIGCKISPMTDLKYHCIITLEDENGLKWLADSYGNIVTTHGFERIGFPYYPSGRYSYEAINGMIELIAPNSEAEVIFDCDNAKQLNEYIIGQKVPLIEIFWDDRNVFSVFNGDKCQLVDIDGNILIPYEAGYSGLHCINKDNEEYLFPACKNGKVGYCNIHGTEKIPFKYDFANHFVNGAAIVGYESNSLEYNDSMYSGRKYWVIDHHNKLLHPFAYARIFEYASINGDVYVFGDRIDLNKRGLFGPDGKEYESFFDIDKSLDKIDIAKKSSWAGDYFKKNTIHREVTSSHYYSSEQEIKYYEKRGYRLIDWTFDGEPLLYEKGDDGSLALYDNKFHKITPSIFNRFDVSKTRTCNVVIGYIEEVGYYIIRINSIFHV